MTIEEFTKEEHDLSMKNCLDDTLLTYDSNPPKPLTMEDLERWTTLYKEEDRRIEARLEPLRVLLLENVVRFVPIEIKFTVIP